MAYAQNTGKDTSLDTDDCSVTHAVVLKLLEGLENRGHHVYMDNYYSSPSLFQHLRRLGFEACGTVRTNRRGVPEEIKAKLQKGEIVSKMIDDDVMALKWMVSAPWLCSPQSTTIPLSPNSDEPGQYRVVWRRYANL